MAGPLNEIDRRLDWTWQHIQEIEGEVNDLLSGGPLYDVSVEPQPDGLTYLYRAHLLRAIPPTLGLQAADCVHNLRATLDNIAWGLVSTYRTPTWGTAFPICRTARRWQERALPKLAGIDQRAIDLIESLQPYHASDRKNHWLVLLDNPWNRDKHRSPMVVGSIPRSTGTYVGVDEPLADFVIYTGRGIGDNMVVGRAVYASREHTHRQPNFAFQIAIEEGGAGYVRRIPTALITNHHLIREQVLNGLRPYFR